MILDALLGLNKGDPLAPHFSFMRDQHEAISPDLFREICGLRYEVYCLECGYLDPEEYQHGLETDDYEHRSTHVAAYNLEDKIVGTVRLVQANTEDDRFPWEEHCSPFPGQELPSKLISAEVSRLVVRKSYRRRAGDSQQGIPSEITNAPGQVTMRPDPNKNRRKKRRSNTPQILLGMYREMYRYSVFSGIRYWYAAMETHLAGSLEKMGFPFRAIGPEVDYYGPVTPYMIDLQELMVNLSKANPFLHAWLNDLPISRWMMIRALLQYSLQSLRRKR